jgi:cell wall-associated NlpC family hydrolase
VEEEAAFVATGLRRTSVLPALVVALSAAVTLTLLPATPSTAEPPLTAAQAQERVDALYSEAEKAAEDFNEADLDVDAAARRMSAVKARISREEAKLAKIQGAIGVFAAASYRNGGLDSSLELLLADDPAQFLERTSSLDQVSRGQGAALRKAAVAQQRLAQDRAELAQETAALDAVKKRAQDAKNRIDAKVDEAQGVLNRLKAAERARYEAAQRARQAESARASRAALRSVSSSTSDSGSSSSSGSSGSSGGFAGGSPASGRAAIAVAAAKAQVGDRYVWGGSGPSSFDCSGLTSFAWRQAGVSLPHQSRAQFAATARVSKGSLQPGDLVFFYSPISHVGIYIGGGLMVHASNPRTGVRVDSINSGHWSGSYVGGGRV